MLMRNVLPHIVLMAALMMAAASCEKHPAGTENLTASVRLSVGTGGNLDAGSDSWTKAAEGYVDPTAYEGLRTIRVIVTSGDADTRRYGTTIQKQSLRVYPRLTSPRKHAIILLKACLSVFLSASMSSPTRKVSVKHIQTSRGSWTAIARYCISMRRQILTTGTFPSAGRILQI